MIFPTFSYISAIFSLSLAVYILVQDWRAFVHRIYAFGMVALALEAGFDGLSLSAAGAEEILKWQILKMAIASFLPGIWLIFALSLGEENYRENISKWRWILIPIFLIPIVSAIFFRGDFFTNGESALIISKGLLPIGWSGKLFHIILIFAAVLILACLERTLRATSGAKRWQVKFMILGVASIFAVRIFTNTQILLYSILDISENALNHFGLIAGNVLMAISLIRMPKMSLAIYPSHSFLYNSAIILIIGAYLIVVGAMAKIFPHFGYRGLPLSFLIIFLAIIFLAIFILSEKVQQKIKEFISRQLTRSHYDYREHWREFTRRTSSLIDIDKLSQAAANFIADTFGVSTVSMWLLDEDRGGFRLSGSTAHYSEGSSFLKLPEIGKANFLEELKKSGNLINFQSSNNSPLEEFKKINKQFFQGKRIKYGIPLVINKDVLGFITINEKVTKKEFTIEDFDLLKTISDQVASVLLNLKLSERLRDLKELEAFRTISAFIMHDLKNVASTLSLTMQNLPFHYNNPDFRQDAVRVTEASLAKINNLCAGLSALSQKIEIKRVKADIHDLILNTFSSLNIIPSSNILSPFREKSENEGDDVRESKIYEWKANNGNDIIVFYNVQNKITSFFFDPEQIQKVIINLLLNARDALKDSGQIKIKARQNENWLEISISDNGCGISKEFVEKSLFRPFKTTKKKGMGIGLFQSKIIVEAHGGKMEVESEENLGTTFRIKLPISRKIE